MATGLQNQEWVPENLRKQLALAVRSIEWSYGIFWSISTTQPGVLEWGDGYYNGDIKTRKTIQSLELNPDQMGLQRSEQLRELYESLATGESNPQTKRPSAALSPEDLTDTEWYYLVCMSFTFDIGQGLPGRTYANGLPTWVCNAHIADSKVFTRSLLAKSASIQTVVCFPFLGGVIELGVIELVSKDLSLVHHIQIAFFERPAYPILSNNFISRPIATQYNKHQGCADLDDEIQDTKLVPLVECGERNMASPDNSSNGVYPNQLAEDCFMVDGMNEGASQVQSWKFMDEEFSNCVHDSTNSSDCISQTFVEPEEVIPTVRGDKLNNHCLLDLQECNDSKLNSLDLRTDDLHYQSVLTSLLKTSGQLVLGLHFGKCNKVSVFDSWKKEGLAKTLQPRCGTSQRLLKKVLFEVGRMHGGCLVDTQEDNGRNGVWRPEVEEIDVNHDAVSERRQREKLNERFSVLRSLISSKNKVDKVSVLDDTIEYLKGLERRVQELETCKESSELEATPTKKHQENVERISDNYVKKPLMNKRKACDIDETESEFDRVSSKDTCSEKITVSVTDKDILIKMRCPWRECLLLKMMDAVSNLHLDSHSVQSSTADGILSVTIKSKLKGSTTVSAATVRKTLQRIVQKCVKL